MNEASTLVPEFSGEDATTLGVVILYEDFSAGVRAKCVADLLIQEMGQPQKMQPALWKVSMLDDRLVVALAERQALNADIVIISLRNGHGLSLPVRAWINRWLTRRSGIGRALVALFEEPGSATDFARRHLESTARRAGMDFLTHTGMEMGSDQLSRASKNWTEVS